MFDMAGDKLRHFTDFNIWCLLWEVDGILVLALAQDGVLTDDRELPKHSLLSSVLRPAV